MDYEKLTSEELFKILNNKGKSLKEINEAEALDNFLDDKAIQKALREEDN